MDIQGFCHSLVCGVKSKVCKMRDRSAPTKKKKPVLHSRPLGLSFVVLMFWNEYLSDCWTLYLEQSHADTCSLSLSVSSNLSLSLAARWPFNFASWSSFTLDWIISGNSWKSTHLHTNLWLLQPPQIVKLCFFFFLQLSKIIFLPVGYSSLTNVLMFGSSNLFQEELHHEVMIPFYGIF